MNYKIVALLLLLVVVLVGGYMLLSKNAGNSTQTQNQNPQTQNLTPTTEITKHEDASVTVTQSGFTPQTLTIKTGTRVVWTNKSGAEVTVNADNHPTHLLWPFLNLGRFDDGSSVSVIFEKQGKYTYHNHLNSSQTGTVIVE